MIEKISIKAIGKLATLIFGLFLTILPAQAQLNVFEPCTGNGPADGNDIRLSGDANFVNGYLRLNNHLGNSKGSMYINKEFSSQMGVVVEFEYWSYGNPGSYGRGDGTSVFLFDGSVTPTTFALGAYGAGLGYGDVALVQQSGLVGGYVAVGLDEYGNWKGRHNPSDLNSPSTLAEPGKPACIGIRGATQYRNRWIDGVMMDTLPFSLDYQVNTTTRPSEDLYYRKVQVALLPSSSGNLFDITVSMQTSVGGPMEIIVGPVATDRAPFPTLKVGLAASTGGAYAIHEIRNLLVTTPGDIRVETTGATQVISGNRTTYTATIYNETPSLLNGVSFMNILPAGFIPDSLPVLNGGSGSVTIVPGSNGYLENTYLANINMPGYSSCTFTFTGRFDMNIPGDRNVTNTAMAHPPSVYTDTDLSNNTNAVTTTVLDRTPEFFVNTIYYRDINGEIICGITQFDFSADTWLTPLSNDFPKWYIDGNEEISVQGESIWSKSLPTGTHTIRMKFTDDDNRIYNVYTTFIVKHHAATDAHIDVQNAYLCFGETIDLNTLVTATGGITNPVFRWYAALSDTISLISSVVSPATNTIYYVSIEGSDHCETDAAHRKEVAITVKEISISSNLTGPDNATIAKGASITLTAASNGIDAPVYQWYNAAGMLVHEGEIYTTATLINTVTYYVSVQGALHCETEPADRRAVTITVVAGGSGYENVPPDEKEVMIYVRLCATLRGTVFPFVQYDEPELESLFPIVAKLYDIALLPQGAQAILATEPLHMDTAAYYDGSEFIPNTPKYPGFSGKLYNPGKTINWHKMGITPRDIDNTPLQENEKPQAGIGIYTFENVDSGSYVLVLSKPGFVPRFAKIKVDTKEMLLGHRELIMGDVNGDFKIDREDLLIILSKFSRFGDPLYDPKYDLNGDLQIDGSDISIMKAYMQFQMEIYEDTEDCFSDN